MLHRWPSTKASFVLVWGVVIWGGSVALAITLIDWYTTHNIGTPYQIVGRFEIFIVGGTFIGFRMWNRTGAVGRKELTLTTGNIVRLVLFISLMLGLAYALWIMSRH